MPPRPGYSNAVDLTISLCLTYTLCIAGIRVWVRRGTYGVDDIVVAAATLVSLGHTAADYVALYYGLGTAWRHVLAKHELDALNQSVTAGIVTFVVALYLSKCASLCFLTRVTKRPSQILLYQIGNGVVAAIGIASVLSLLIGCPFNSGYTWAIYRNKLGGCPSQTLRWQIFTALDVVTEILLMALPVQLVWPLQMPVRKKAKLLVAFYLRLPAIGISIARNYAILQLRLASSNPGLLSGIVTIWIEVQLAYVLASSTLSASKGFIETFNSGFGQGFVKNEGSYGASAASRSNRESRATTKKSRHDSAIQEATLGFPYEGQTDAQDSGRSDSSGAESTRAVLEATTSLVSDGTTSPEPGLPITNASHVDEETEWAVEEALKTANPGWRPTSSIYSRGSRSVIGETLFGWSM